MATYMDIDSVSHGTVRLAARVRTDTDKEFKCLSWRARRLTSATNRYLYLEHSEFWTLPLDTVTKLLRQAKERGMFASKGERWPDAAVETIDSNRCTMAAKSRLVDEILTQTPHDDVWRDASDCRYLIGVEPDGLWRKALILSPSLRIATLRSLTLQDDYVHKYNFPLLNGWHIDKSMLDADAEIHDFYLSAFA